MRWFPAIILLLPLPLLGADPPATRPANIHPATWQRMLAIDAKAGEVHDLTANFEQQKFTAMLKKPLVSRGRILVKGPTMLWNTTDPEPSVLRISEHEARIYYPQQKTIEVYQVQQKLGELAASPVPRLGVLVRHFSFEPIPLSDMGETDTNRFFAVRMTPLEADLAEHVEQMRVLLDRDRGLIRRLEMRDPDGDRTVISFSDVQTNVGLSDEQLKIHPSGEVKITRPLEAVEGNSSSDAASPNGAASSSDKGR